MNALKALAILEMKDGVIEKLEGQLDAVQSKMAETKCQYRVAEDRQMAAERERLAAQERGREAMLEEARRMMAAEERAEAAAAEAREARAECRAAEVVAGRLASELELRGSQSIDISQLEETLASGRARLNAPPPQLSPQLPEELATTVRLAVQRHKVQVASEPPFPETSWKSEKAPKEDLLTERQQVNARRQHQERRALQDLAKAESVLEDAKKEVEKVKKQHEEIVLQGKKRRSLQQADFESDKDLETLRNELHMVKNATEAELLAAAGAYSKLEDVLKARLKQWNVPKEEAIPVLHVVEPSLAAQLKEAEELGAEMQQDLLSMRRDAKQQAQRREKLQKELVTAVQELKEVPALPTKLPLPRLPLRLARQLSQIGSPGAVDLHDALEQLLRLLREQRQQLRETAEGQMRWSWPGTGVWQPMVLQCSRLQEDLEEHLAAEESAKIECSRLKAVATVLRAELVQARQQEKVLEAQCLVEAASCTEAELNESWGNWRDELIEGVWTMAQRAGCDALPAEQVMRILGLQLTASELAWTLKKRQIMGDQLLRANASKEGGRDLEAERLKMQRMRLNSEVRAMSMELQESRSASYEDQELLNSMLTVMREAMQVSSRLVTESGTASSEILRELQDVSSCCQELQQLVQQSSAQESQISQDARDVEWPERLERLLEVQHETQLEYRAAAEEVLRLREGSRELAQAQRRLAAQKEPSWPALPALATISPPQGPGVRELEELCNQRREMLAAARAEAADARSDFQEACLGAAAAKTYAVAVRGWAQAAEREAQLALEAEAVAQQEELEAQVLQRRRRLAEDEEMAAEELRVLQEQEAHERRRRLKQEEKSQEEARLHEDVSESLVRVQRENLELRARCAPLRAHAAELRRRRQALEPAAQDFPAEALPALVAQLETVGRSIEDREMKLISQQIQEQEEEAQIMVCNAEASAQRQVAQELLESLESQELSLEALEARGKWHEMAQKDEHLEWRQQMKALQQRGWEAKEAQEAAEQSKQEVECLVEQDALTVEVEKLEEETQRLHEQIGEVSSPKVQRLQLQGYLDELGMLRRHKDSLLKEMDGLRSQLEDAPAPHVAQAKRVRRSVPEDGQKQREALRQQLQVQKKEEERLRNQLKEVERQLALSREDAERKRSFVAQLQRSLETREAEPQNLEQLEQEVEKARQHLAKKDVQLQRLRVEAQSSKKEREELQKQRHEEAVRAESEAARTAYLQAELRRKDRALTATLALSEDLESRLERVT